MLWTCSQNSSHIEPCLRVGQKTFCYSNNIANSCIEWADAPHPHHRQMLWLEDTSTCGAISCLLQSATVSCKFSAGSFNMCVYVNFDINVSVNISSYNQFTSKIHILCDAFCICIILLRNSHRMICFHWELEWKLHAVWWIKLGIRCLAFQVTGEGIVGFKYEN